jgi:peptidoglycan/xylan/chitin deacetylase (PgdA/CDA1 family)
MIAQIVFSALFIGLYKIGLPIYYNFAVFLIIYWLPKFIFVKLLEFIYPQVIVRFNSANHIALTFDDMPDGYHQEIINMLNTHHQKATFFIISSQVNDKNINIFVDAVKAGHQLGNHGMTNSAHFFKNRVDLTKEICECDILIKRIYRMANIALPKTMVYRPGCGLFGPEMLKIAAEFGYKIALGSVYPNDTIIRNSFVNYLYVMCHISPGDVVILHDRKWTPETLRQILASSRWQGMLSGTIDELQKEDELYKDMIQELKEKYSRSWV